MHASTQTDRRGHANMHTVACFSKQPETDVWAGLNGHFVNQESLTKPAEVLCSLQLVAEVVHLALQIL